MVQATATDVSFDGVIEPFELRRVIDRTSIDMPFTHRGFRASLSIENQMRESILVKDLVDDRDDPTRPFLDTVEGLSNVDIPGAFSDKESHIGPFTDTDDIHLFYSSVSSPEIMSILTEGISILSGSTYVTHTAKAPLGIRDDVTISRHGFVFSQNDNYGYDSIVYGGLKK
jgi:hypothetical protein